MRVVLSWSTAQTTCARLARAVAATPSSKTRARPPCAMPKQSAGRKRRSPPRRARREPCAPGPKKTTAARGGRPEQKGLKAGAREAPSGASLAPSPLASSHEPPPPGKRRERKSVSSKWRRRRAMLLPCAHATLQGGGRTKCCVCERPAPPARDKLCGGWGGKRGVLRPPPLGKGMAAGAASTRVARTTHTHTHRRVALHTTAATRVVAGAQNAVSLSEFVVSAKFKRGGRERGRGVERESNRARSCGRGVRAHALHAHAWGLEKGACFGWVSSSERETHTHTHTRG